ncbi:Fructosamine/Ketosamine-3-kinase [Naematelia encephala]|uniref:protein-ribulosamine 3-kinase n=1 Tax=Naematelia encephala TaxID=71784 RepID=A0A1Y2BJT3_9TREE|nr:Fructosamine/Ketosamine-3-kinase [Naematelia encephala]
MPGLHPLTLSIFKSAGIDASVLTPSRGFVSDPSTGEKYFCKTGSNVAQMRGETESLRAMALTAPSLVPRVVGFEVNGLDREAGMVSQYFDFSSSRSADAQKALGQKLAEMHRPPKGNTGEYNGKYGFGVPTHCGVTEQDNTWEENWEVFYRDRRLGDLVRRIGDGQINQEWERMKDKVVPLLLSDIQPPPKPVILHGDLWSGNVGFDSASSSPIIFDPSSYYGHNEADLGITHMFGGFSSAFYEAYHEIHPKSEPYYEERQKLYELYHHLNHTLMFGGGYRSGSLSIMRGLIKWADDL